MAKDELATKTSTIAELKKFFTPEGESMSIAEFKAEWDQLSDEEKDWFKAQSLE
jgi:hypothetical protein